MFSLFRRPDPAHAAARALFDALAAKARSPEFYTTGGVQDSMDGRFDLLVLHAFLAMEALRAAGEAGKATGTHLATITFQSLEGALRDLGIGDMGMSRRIKAMANAFYGRLSVYSDAGDESAMGDALLRNLYRGDAAMTSHAANMADYVLAALRRLRTPEAAAEALAGRIVFPPLAPASALS
jgi:cytochrome b pre-mRNA-processing protein 3